MSSTAIDKDLPLGIPLWDRPRVEEPAHGLLLRLCELNGYPFVNNVSRETGLSVSRLRRGEQFADLARLVRCDVDRIARDSFRSEGEAFVGIRRQTIGSARDLDCSRRRACPACLCESVHHRFWWDLGFMSSCPRHGIDLLDRCACAAQGALSWFDGSLLRGRCCRYGDLRDGEHRESDPDVCAMDRYMAGRLGLETPTAIDALDELSLYDAVDVLERVGALHAGGWSERWRRSSNVDLAPAANRAAAFAILRDDRMQDVLEAVYDQFLASPLKDAPKLTVAYGWFYHWYNLKGHRRFSGYLTDQIYRHASTRFRIDVRATDNKSGFLSQETTDNIDRFNEGKMTLVAAAKECGKHLLQVRRLATHYGLMRAEKMNGRTVTLRTADVAVMKFLFARWVNKQEAAAILGINVAALFELVEGGVLTPFIPGNVPGSQVYRFLRDDVEGVLTRISSKVDPERCDAGGKYVLAKRSWTGPPSIFLAVAAILRGSMVPVHEDHDASGLRRFHVNRTDVRAERLKINGSVGGELEKSAAPDFEHWRDRMSAIEAGGRRPIVDMTGSRNRSSPTVRKTPEVRRNDKIPFGGRRHRVYAY